MMRKASNVLLKFGIPSLLWIFLFQPFLWGPAVVGPETFYLYSLIKYFWDNIKMGIFPSWNPFLLCGAPEQILLNHYVGVFNPLWLLTALLNSLGLNFYHSFIWTIVLYHFLGQIGFYLLAKIILRSARAAHIAFLLLFFSSFSLMMLLQYHPVLFFVPSVWFFYFLCCFQRAPKTKFLVGMILSLMVLFCAYLPLYFITVFILVGILGLLLYPQKICETFKKLGQFSCAHKRSAIVCAAALLISLLSGFQAYKSIAAHEILAVMRTKGEDAYKAGVSFSNFKQTTDGALSARMSWDDLYSNLDHIEYGNDGIFYVPIFAYLALLLCVFNKINRKIIFFSLLSLALLLLCLSNATPVHKFLYDHLFYFKLLRNLHFFLPCLLAAFVLLTAEQLKLILNQKSKSNHGYALRLGWIILVHAGAAIFLHFQENVIISSYISIFLSLIFWIIYLSRRIVSTGFSVFKRSPYCFFLSLICLSILIQPAEVFWRYNHASIGREDFIKQCRFFPAATPQFSYTRPPAPPAESSPVQEHIATAWYRLAMMDSPVIVPYQNGFLPYWTYFASEKIPAKVFQAYTHYKFWIFSRGELSGHSPEDLRKMAKAWQTRGNIAFINREEKKIKALHSLLTKPADASQQAIALEGPSQEFKVTNFNTQSLAVMTNFAEDKFLIYNDSYFENWEGFLNGKKIPIYRANLAFKGIFLPAGSNRLFLIYNSGDYVEFLIWMVFIGILIWMIVLFCARHRMKE